MALAATVKLQPQNISILTPIGVKTQMMKLSASPFYKNERLITNLVGNMLNQGNEQAVFHLLKNIIEIEKTWRMEMCVRVFGPEPCKMEMSSEAFYLWKKTFIYNLRKDPTQEISNRIWKNLATQE